MEAKQWKGKKKKNNRGGGGLSVWTLCVIDSFISSVQYANALLLAGAQSYCTPPLLPYRSSARRELAEWYSCLFRCAVGAAQQTQDLLLQLHHRV